ncbi:MAG: hypothetical protein ACKO5K_11515, partial [Armatimonadota bacterium]
PGTVCSLDRVLRTMGGTTVPEDQIVHSTANVDGILLHEAEVADDVLHADIWRRIWQEAPY